MKAEQVRKAKHGGKTAVLSGVVREGLTDKVIPEKELEGSNE